MKKTKPGFTLAEVATSLTIVGVIAAMLIPQLVKNTQKNQTDLLKGCEVVLYN